MSTDLQQALHAERHTDELTSIELHELLDREAIIERGLRSFIEVGEALTWIRDERLYRDLYSTFEDYCYQKWDLGKSRAYQLIDSADTVAQMSTIVDVPQIENEAQARAVKQLLTDRTPNDVAEILREVKGKRDSMSAKAILDAAEPEPETIEVEVNVIEEPEDVSRIHVVTSADTPATPKPTEPEPEPETAKPHVSKRTTLARSDDVEDWWTALRDKNDDFIRKMSQRLQAEVQSLDDLDTISEQTDDLQTHTREQPIEAHPYEIADWVKRTYKATDYYQLFAAMIEAEDPETIRSLLEDSFRETMETYERESWDAAVEEFYGSELEEVFDKLPTTTVYEAVRDHKPMVIDLIKEQLAGDA